MPRVSRGGGKVQEESFEFVCRVFLCGGVRGWPFTNPGYFEERGHVTLYRCVYICVCVYMYIYMCIYNVYICICMCVCA